eukprot:CAMPEP_0174702150 /NCGR_PEP_ID=MMETSP1094-20130205/6532_1 /TAXON_ID=156173 /ORGANISM="Chrysochromulina brevifilum, Strain UTEX LB 985" /LENGTH=66 /DNA_ID=CAMNT_0015899889 /DNA_START=451 /DNA_END=652 /DNA_ORIENTATION=-
MPTPGRHNLDVGWREMKLEEQLINVLACTPGPIEVLACTPGPIEVLACTPGPINMLAWTPGPHGGQ